MTDYLLDAGGVPLAVDLDGEPTVPRPPCTKVLADQEELEYLAKCARYFGYTDLSEPMAYPVSALGACPLVVVALDSNGSLLSRGIELVVDGQRMEPETMVATTLLQYGESVDVVVDGRVVGSFVAQEGLGYWLPVVVE